jgi:hypothetical protein
MQIDEIKNDPVDRFFIEDDGSEGWEIRLSQAYMDDIIERSHDIIHLEQEY